MGFKEVQSLEADVTIALGKKDKSTGKLYPKQAEGYYLGSRTVENKRGESQLHFLQTPKGNLGLWGTTDLNRKLSSVEPGTMVRITSTGMKPTQNGDMYTYKVEVDSDNTIDVSLLASSSVGDEDGGEESDDSDSGYSTGDDYIQDEPVMSASAESRAAKVKQLLKR